MSKYSCLCPSPGCGYVLEVASGSWEEAFKKMFVGEGKHLVENHPDFPDLDESIRQYALENMKHK